MFFFMASSAVTPEMIIFYNPYDEVGALFIDGKIIGALRSDEGRPCLLGW